MTRSRILAVAFVLSLLNLPAAAQEANRSPVEVIATLSGPTKKIVEIAFSPSGELVAASSKDGTVHVWNVASGKSLATIAGQKNSEPSDLRWSNDGRRLVFTHHTKKSSELLVCEISSSEPPTIRHRLPVNRFEQWSPDSRTFLAFDLQRNLKLWDAFTGEPIHTLTPAVPRDQPWTISFVAGGERVLIVAGEEMEELWDVATGKLIATSVPDTSDEGKRYESPDRKTFITVHHDDLTKRRHRQSYLTLRTTTTGQELQTFQVPEGMSHIFWSPDGKTIAVMGYEFNTRIFDATTGRQNGRLPYGNCWPWQLCGSDDCEALRFSADGAVLLKEKEPIKLWDTRTVSLIRELKTAHLPAAFSPTDAQLLATRSDDKKSVLLWRLGPRTTSSLR